MDDLKNSQSGLNKVIDDQTQEIAALKANLETEINNFKELSTKNTAMSDLSSELSDLNRQKYELKSAAESLSNQKSELEEKLKQLLADLDESKNELKQKSDKEIESSSLIESLKSEEANFKNQIHTLNQAVEELKAIQSNLSKQLEQTKEKLSESHSREEFERIRETLDAKKADELKLLQRIDELSAAKIEMDENLQQYNTNLNEAHKHESEDFLRQIGELNKLVESASQEKSRLTNEVETTAVELENSRTMLKKHENDHEQLKNEIQQLKNEHEALQSKISLLNKYS